MTADLLFQLRNILIDQSWSIVQIIATKDAIATLTLAPDCKAVSGPFLSTFFPLAAVRLVGTFVKSNSYITAEGKVIISCAYDYIRDGTGPINPSKARIVFELVPGFPCKYLISDFSLTNNSCDA